MNLIAMIVLAPVLGYFVADRRRVHAALVVVWAVIMMFQTHLVLLENQSADASYAGTAIYFAVNYVFLAVGIGVGTLVHRHRRRNDDVDRNGVAAVVQHEATTP